MPCAMPAHAPRRERDLASATLARASIAYMVHAYLRKVSSYCYLPWCYTCIGPHEDGQEIYGAESSVAVQLCERL